MKKTSAVLVCALLLNSFPAFAAAQLPPLELEKEYFIEAGDVLSINVFPAEEFSKEVTVQPDGNIELPLLGSVKVRGLRAGDLEKLMTAKFSRYVSNPGVTVNVRKFAANRVAVIGEVRAPGYHEYREGMKILDLVAEAGGFADYPRAEKTRIFRRSKDADGKTREEVVRVDLSAVMDGRLDKNIVLSAGDIVYVPRKRVYKTARWISDNFLPWATLATFAITVGLITSK